MLQFNKVKPSYMCIYTRECIFAEYMHQHDLKGDEPNCS